MSKQKQAVSVIQSYDRFATEIQQLLAEARRQAARSVNAIMTAVYWEIGRRIVDFEQKGQRRAEYGEELLQRLSADLTATFGRGFGVDNLQRMRMFYQLYPSTQIYASLMRKSSPTPTLQLVPTVSEIVQTLSEQFRAAPEAAKSQTLSGKSGLESEPEKSASLMRRSLRSPIGRTVSALSLREYLGTVAQVFPLSWTHYIRLLAVKNPHAREFYEAEALRGGWSVRQLDRQIQSQFYERTALSRDKAAMLLKGAKPLPEDTVTPEEEIKDPFVLEFLGLKDEYSESDLEEALIQHLETFLLELGGDFAFIGRQKRMRIGNEWYRLDLLFFHRLLRCLLLIDLKVGKFTHADAGQMNLCLNYAREHWVRPGENAPVGLILCSEKDAAVAHYALDGLPSKVLAAEYRTALPDERELAEEVRRTRLALEARTAVRR